MTQKIDKYEVIEQIGSGSVGSVYKVADETGQVFALKLLDPNQQFSKDSKTPERFLREIKILKSIDHKNIVNIVDFSLLDNAKYFVMDYIDGVGLDEYVKSHGVLAGDKLVDFFDELSIAIKSLHSQGIMHNDIKPSNIIVSSDGSPILIDFSISKAFLDTHLTQTGLITGTPSYLSPEGIAGIKDDEAGDFWALTATLAFAATGRAAYKSINIQEVLAHINTGVINLATLPEKVARSIADALNPDKAERISFDELLDRLDALSDGDNWSVKAGPFVHDKNRRYFTHTFEGPLVIDNSTKILEKRGENATEFISEFEPDSDSVFDDTKIDPTAVAAGLAGLANARVVGARVGGAVGGAGSAGADGAGVASGASAGGAVGKGRGAKGGKGRGAKGGEGRGGRRSGRSWRSGRGEIFSDGSGRSGVAGSGSGRSGVAGSGGEVGDPQRKSTFLQYSMLLGISLLFVGVAGLYPIVALISFYLLICVFCSIEDFSNTGSFVKMPFYVLGALILNLPKLIVSAAASFGIVFFANSLLKRVIEMGDVQKIDFAKNFLEHLDIPTGEASHCILVLLIVILAVLTAFSFLFSPGAYKTRSGVRKIVATSLFAKAIQLVIAVFMCALGFLFFRYAAGSASIDLFPFLGNALGG
jgi:serine/threonine protein kinase